MLKKLILKLAIFFALLIILDLIIGTFLKKIYFAQNHGPYFRTTYVFENAIPEIIILGSSKANHHYIPTIIQDSLKLSCYNGGRDANFILYSNAALNCILKRYSPKFVVLDILDDEFEERSYKLQNKLSSLLPYYGTHPEIREIVELKSPYEKYKLYSGMYTFNTLLLSSITGTLDLHNKKVDEITMGYLPLYEKWDGDIKVIDSQNEKLDSNKIKALTNIINACKVNNIKLIIVVSPSYKKYEKNYSPTIEHACKIAVENNVPFWNYLQDTSFLNHKSYFMDIRHLNNNGAVEFTKDIVKRLKEIK